MTNYRIIPIKASLAPRDVHADVSLSDELSTKAEFTTTIRHNSVADYDLLQNRPQINSVLLTGNRSLPELGVETISNMDLENLLK
jgi:hypothetical protein